jgi:hypothetical protein
MYAYSFTILEWLKSLLTIGGSKQLTSGRLLDPSHQEQIHDLIKHLEPTVNIDDIPADQLSTKVLTLNKLVVDYKEKDDQRDFHCIVFVERRQHAQLLCILLERNAQLKGFIRPVPLTGHGASHENDLIGIKMDSKTVDISSYFRFLFSKKNPPLLIPSFLLLLSSIHYSKTKPSKNSGLANTI